MRVELQNIRFGMPDTHTVHADLFMVEENGNWLIMSSTLENCLREIENNDYHLTNMGILADFFHSSTCG